MAGMNPSKPDSAEPYQIAGLKMTDNLQKMLRGELYHAFVPDLIAARRRSAGACSKYNTTQDTPRREKVAMIREILCDSTPLPPRPLEDASPLLAAEEDEALFEEDPWIDPPFKADYGFNIRLGANVYINFNCVILDTCVVSIGSRTLLGPNISLFSGTHPLDPVLRNGTKGPESGKEIRIGEDCWLGGNVVVLPGVTIGKGCTIGAGSVVTKDVPDYHVVAGNPARVIRKIETSMDPDQAQMTPSKDQTQGAEGPMASIVPGPYGGLNGRAQ